MAVSPVTRELIKGALSSAIREMEVLIDRTSMSAMIKEKKDFFVGMFDARGRLIDAHVSFTGPGLITPVLATYPAEDMRPGDVYWYNDPYFSGGAIQHLGDMCFITPVFAPEDQRRVVAFSATFGHFRDIGGTRAGSISPGATEIFHEGTRVPPIRIIRAGEMNQEAYRVILANSRFPADLEGDTRALMASCRLGEARISEVLRRHGSQTVSDAFDDLITSTRTAARALLHTLVPEGEYSFHDYADDDGITGRSYKVAMTLQRMGDRVTIDISDSDPQAKGPINFLVTRGYLNLLFGRYLMSLDPTLPLNEGLLDTIDELIAKPGTVTQPRYPGATGLRSHVRQRVSSCMLGVLNEATRGNASANSPVYILYTLRMFDERSGSFDVCSEGVGAGLGARPYADGVNAIYFAAQQNFPIEFIEREHDLLVERFTIKPDSGGPGKYRGGCGVVRDIRVLGRGAVLSTRMDNVRYPCWGVAGGRAGRTGAFILNPGTPNERVLPPIGDDLQVAAGDVLRVATCGGGGWGDPFDRDPEHVRRDVLEGFVTVQGARDDYGVVLDPETLRLDGEETARLRGPRPQSGIAVAGAAVRFDRGT
ncbi:MAG: hydantoinase B/oxoprolinase family protein [Chloroflexi bacterium]|nr:hydantoinase B/oxoprolinase family protein [Chloroflexota bacterium]